MNTLLQTGTKIKGSTGTVITLKSVTDKRVTWNVLLVNDTLTSVWTSLKKANKWVEQGIWTIVE